MSESSEVTLLQRRLEALERRQRRTRFAFVLLAGAAAAPYLMGAVRESAVVTVPLIRAEQIDLMKGDSVIVSLKGFVGRKLHDGDTLAHGLGVLSPAGKLTSALISDNTGGNLYLYGLKEQTLAEFYTKADGSGLDLEGINGNRAVELLATPTGGGEIYVHDTAGTYVGELISRGDSVGGGGALILLDRKRNRAIYAGERDNQVGGIINVYNSDGTTIADMFARQDGKGGDMGVMNASGKRMASMFTADTTGGSVSIFSNTGTHLASLFRRKGRGGQLVVYDDRDSVSAALMSREDGYGGDLEVYDNAGKTLGGLYAHQYGGVLSVHDRNGTRVAAMEPATTNSGGVVDVYSASGNRVATIFARTDGGADIQVMNSSGQRAAALFITSDGDGRLQLYDRTGTLKHAVP